MQALTCCDAEFMSTRTTAGQFQGEFKGSMECYMRGFDLAPELTAYCHNTPQNSEHTSGAMERYTLVRFAGHWRKCHRRVKKGERCPSYVHILL